MSQEEDLARAKEMISRAEALVVLTGAGISAESGVPTFRGEEGLWKTYRAEELATPQAFSQNPVLVWEWYQWRRRLIAGVKPNPGHLALARLEDKANNFLLLTQNVDGLHSLANNKRVLEIHGNIWKTQCTGCGQKREDRRLELKLPPRCDNCGGLLRPAVVWFGESLDPEILSQATRALASSDLMLVVGTSGIVQPAASFPFWAKEAGAKIVEVNLERTPLSSVSDVVLLGKAAQMLPRLLSS